MQCIVIATGLGVLSSAAAEWTQYRGPNHNGTSTERINKQWSGSVTNPVWLVHLTNGVTSLTVGGGRVFTQVGGDIVEEGAYQLARKEYCLALDAATGNQLWSTETEASGGYLFPNLGVGFTDDGPRSTPVVLDGSVYVLSSYLKLYRLNATNGAIIWSTNLVTGFGGSVIAWQNAASPVVENGLLFVNANAPTASLMAFNVTNGALVWRSQNEAMTHATPVLATIHGVRQLIFATQSGLVSVSPQNGTLVWKATHPFGYSTSLGTSPVVHQDHVFVTANYSMSAYAVQIVLSNSVQVPMQRWAGAAHQSHWSTPVAYAGHLYGMFYPDNANGQLRCIDLATGATRWATNNFGRSSLLLVGTNLLCITERGALVLAAARTNAYQELARFQAIPNYHPDQNKCWNAMALSDGQVYIRSTAYAARFDLSVPDLMLDPPQFTSNTLQLTIRTATGTDVEPSRLAAMEVRASTNVGWSPAMWPKLTNSLVLTNGLVRVTNVDAGPPRRYFIVSEPQ